MFGTAIRPRRKHPPLDEEAQALAPPQEIYEIKPRVRPPVETDTASEARPALPPDEIRLRVVRPPAPEPAQTALPPVEIRPRRLTPQPAESAPPTTAIIARPYGRRPTQEPVTTAETPGYAYQIKPRVRPLQRQSEDVVSPTAPGQIEPRVISPQMERQAEKAALSMRTTEKIKSNAPVVNGTHDGDTQAEAGPGFVNLPLPPSAASQQPSQQTGDVALTPPQERRQAIDDAAAQGTPTATATGEASTPSNQLDLLDQKLRELEELERAPVTDKNGRLKSFFINFARALAPSMHSAMQNAAARGRAVTWGDFFTGLAGAGGAGAGGVIDPASDERAARLEQIARKHGELDQLMKKYKLRAEIERAHAQADAARAATGTKADKQAKAEAKTRLTIRRQQRGGKLDLNDPDTKADLATLGINGMTVPHGTKPIPGVNIKWNPVLGKWQYSAIDDETGRPTMVVMDEDTQQAVRLSENDRRRYEIERIDNNRKVAEFVARYGREAAEEAGLRMLPSLEEEETQPAQPGSATPAPTGETPPQASPTNQTPQPNVNTPPVRPSSDIPPGLPEKQRPYGGGSGPHRRGRRSYGRGTDLTPPDSRGTQINRGQLGSDLRQIEGFKAEARRALSEGRTVDAQAAAEQANRAAERVLANQNYRGMVRRGVSSGVNGVELPNLEMVAPEESAPRQKKGRISRSDVKKIAAENGVTPDEAERQLSVDYVIED
jgi:hypothetical protein